MPACVLRLCTTEAPAIAAGSKPGQGRIERLGVPASAFPSPGYKLLYPHTRDRPPAEESIAARTPPSSPSAVTRLAASSKSGSMPGPGCSTCVASGGKVKDGLQAEERARVLRF